jgi:hypothetical protein
LRRWARAKAGDGQIVLISGEPGIGTQFQKGLDQLALLPNTPGRWRQELEFWSALGAVLQALKGSAAAEAGHAYARARELWEKLGSPSEFLRIPYGQSVFHMNRGELDLSLRLDEDLLRLSRRRKDSGGLVLGHLSSGRTLFFAGRFAQSRSHLEEVPALYDPISHGPLVRQSSLHPQVVSQAVLGNVLFCLGYPDRALVQSGAAVARKPRDWFIRRLWPLAWLLAPGCFRSLETTPSLQSGWTSSQR